MQRKKIIQGSGSKKKKAETPTQTTTTAGQFVNNIASKNTARLIDIISEGQCYGLVNGAKSIYFDDTVLENADGSRNFSGVTYDYRLGTADQEYYTGFPEVEEEVSVGVALDYGSPITRTITDSNVNALRIKIRVPTLFSTSASTGVIGDSQVFTVVEVRPFGGSYSTISLNNGGQILGTSNSPIEVAYRVPLPEGGAPWDVRVSRGNAVENTSLHQNGSFWSTYTKLTDAKLMYPYTATIATILDKQLFGQELPTRSYDWKGIICNIPDNYNTTTRAYTGVWSGTFTTGWTDNPAWVLYDLIVNNRYGLGEYISASQLDKFSFYEMAQYNDELVDDGQGGTEPRFTFNGVIQSAQDAIDVLNAVASNFRAMVYWSAGAVTVVQDSPADVIKLVTPANVIGGKFNYSGTALSATHSAALVSWNDPDDSYKLNIAVVEDQTAINDIGWRKTDTVAIGCTSNGQAIRFGKWIIDTEKYATETVTYNAGWDHADVFPGQIIHIADPTYADIRFGGRMVSYSGNQFITDDDVVLASGETYTLSIQLEDGTIGSWDITNSAGTTSILNLSGDIDAVSGDPTPVPGAIWIITGSDVEPRPFRVIGTREVEKHIFEVTALLHDPTKYDRIESGVIVAPANYTNFPTGALTPPTNISFSEYLFQSTSGVRSAILIGWTLSADARAEFYEISVKGPTDTDYRVVNTGSTSSFTYLDNIAGVYYVKVRAIDGLGGLRSTYLEGIYEAGGLTVAPADVENFNINVIDTNAYLSWDPVTDLDLSYYQIRYSPNTVGVTWGSSSILRAAVNKTDVSAVVPAMVGTYSIKAVDLSAVESANATFIQSTISGINNLNVIEVMTEDPTFSGEKVDTAVSTSLLKLQVEDTWDDYDNVDYIDNVDLGSAPQPTTVGYYYFTNLVDLGAVFTSRVTPNISVYGENVLSLIDTWADVDDVTNWDGAEESDWLCEFQIATSQDQTDTSDTIWTDYTPCVVGDYSARGLEFRLKLTSLLFGVTPVVESASVSIDMPDRVDGQNNLTLPDTGLDITFSPAFKETPAIATAVQNLATGDYVTVTAQSSTGFTIRAYNAAGVGVARTFDFVAKGWGYVVA